MNELPGEMRSARWLRRHALLAPFGVCGATALLAYLAVRQGDYPSFLMSAGELVDLGAAVYGMVAVVIEKGLDVMFWALEQRKKRIEKAQAEWSAKGRVEGRAEGYAVAQKEFSARLRDAHEKGVVEDLLRELDDARANRNGA